MLFRSLVASLTPRVLRFHATPLCREARLSFSPVIVTSFGLWLVGGALLGLLGEVLQRRAGQAVWPSVPRQVFTTPFTIGLSDTAVMDMMISNLQQQRQVTEQLRREAAIKRITVSQAVQDIMKFITDHEQEDCLVVGFSSEKANPFREKSSCILL